MQGPVLFRALSLPGRFCGPMDLCQTFVMQLDRTDLGRTLLIRSSKPPPFIFFTVQCPFKFLLSLNVLVSSSEGERSFFSARAICRSACLPPASPDAAHLLSALSFSLVCLGSLPLFLLYALIILLIYIFGVSPLTE